MHSSINGDRCKGSRSRLALMLTMLALMAGEASSFVGTTSSVCGWKSSGTFRLTAPISPCLPVQSHRTLKTSRKYTNAANTPLTPKSIGRNLRDFIGSTNKKGRRRSNADGVQKNDVVTVNTLEEFKSEVAEVDDRIVVVRFFATWCKACRAMEASFHRLASTYKNVKIVEVPVTQENSNLHQGLGVPSVPFGHIYHPTAGLVEEMKLTRREFSHFERKLEAYAQGFCDIGRNCADPYPRRDDSSLSAKGRKLRM